MNWHTQLRTYGYAHFPGLTPASLALAAREAIDMDLRDNYDSDRATFPERFRQNPISTDLPVV